MVCEPAAASLTIKSYSTHIQINWAGERSFIIPGATRICSNGVRELSSLPTDGWGDRRANAVDQDMLDKVPYSDRGTGRRRDGACAFDDD